MKQSEKLLQEYSNIRIRTIAEIMLLVKKHKDIEMEIEFDDPIAFAAGYDEQDEAQLIENVTEDGSVEVFHQGNDMGSVKLEQLDTEKLIEILKGLEKSFENAIDFSKK